MVHSHNGTQPSNRKGELLIHTQQGWFLKPWNWAKEARQHRTCTYCVVVVYSLKEKAKPIFWDRNKWVALGACWYKVIKSEIM